VQAGESYLDCHIHVDTLVSRASQPEALGCDILWFAGDRPYESRLSRNHLFGGEQEDSCGVRSRTTDRDKSGERKQSHICATCHVFIFVRFFLAMFNLKCS
jgi:hypothetical protein